MIRHIDDRLLNFGPYQLNLIFRLEHHLGASTFLCLFPCRVPDLDFDRAGVALFSVGRHIGEQDAFLAMALHWLRALERLLAPALQPAVQVIGPIVGGQFIGLAVETGDPRITYPVGNPSYGLAEERRFGIWLYGGIPQHDVVARDLELLDDGPGGQERHPGFRRHDFVWLDLDPVRWHWRESSRQEILLYDLLQV